MSETKLLTIVVPTYNVEAYLANCLESLIRQDLTAKDYEVIVVNDGSTDRSPEIADSYSAKYPQISVINQVNQGLSAARNTGMRAARGKYLYFIDSDDYLAHNTLGYALHLMEFHKLDFLGLQIKNTDRLDIIQPNNPEVAKNERLMVLDGISFIAENHYPQYAWWYITRRQLINDLGLEFPVGRFVEDANFTANLIASSQRMARSNLDFYRYVNRPGSIMRKRTKAHAIKMVEDYAKNALDFEVQISALRKKKHPKLDACLRRLEARQQSFVFFLLAKAIQNQLSLKEIAPILDKLSEIRAYPLNKFIGKDYNKMSFQMLQWIMNRRFTLRLALSTSAILHKLFPNSKLFMRR